jgi:hypothetical protein
MMAEFVGFDPDALRKRLREENNFGSDDTPAPAAAPTASAPAGGVKAAASSKIDADARRILEIELAEALAKGRTEDAAAVRRELARLPGAPAGAASAPARTFGDSGDRTPEVVVTPTPPSESLNIGPEVAAGAGALVGGSLAYGDPGTTRGFLAPGAGTQAQMAAAAEAARAGPTPFPAAGPNPFRDQLAAMDVAAAPAVAAPVAPANESLLLSDEKTQRITSGGDGPTLGTTGEERSHFSTNTGENAANYRGGKEHVASINEAGLAEGNADPLRIKTHKTASKQGIVVTQGTTNQNSFINEGESVPSPGTVAYKDPRTGKTVYLQSVDFKDEKTGKTHRVPHPAAVNEFHRAERQVAMARLQRDAILRVEATERNQARQNLERQAAEHDLQVKDSAREAKRLESATEQAARRAGLAAGVRKVGAGAGLGALGAYSAYQSGRGMIDAARAPDATFKSVANAANVPDVANVVTGLSMIPYGRAAKVAGPVGGAAQMLAGGLDIRKNKATPENVAQIGSGAGMAVFPYNPPLGAALMTPEAALALKRSYESLAKDNPRLAESMAAAMGASGYGR